MRSVLKAVPLPLLIFFMYGSQITAWIVTIPITLFTSPLTAFLALLVSLLVTIRLFQVRVPFGDLASLDDRSLTFSSLVISISFGLFTVGSYFPEFRIALHWVSMLTFLISYVSIIYGRTLAKAIIPIAMAFMPLALPPITFSLSLSYLGVTIIKDRFAETPEVCGYDHEEISSGDLCRFCGETSMSIQKKEVPTKTILRLAVIGLLVLVFNSTYVPAFVVDDDRFVFARYTPKGVLTENIVQIKDSDYVISMSDLSSDNRPLANVTSESLEVVELARSSATLETYQLDDDSERLISLMTVTRVIPYFDGQGNLTSDQLTVYILGGSELGEVADLENELILAGNQINQRLLIPIQLTLWRETFSSMFSQSIPFLISVIVAISLLVAAMWIRRSEVERDHKITLTSSFPRNMGLLALIALSAGFRERLRGTDLYDKARRMGYDGSIKEIVDDLSELERRDFLFLRPLVHRGRLLRFWTVRI